MGTEKGPELVEGSCNGMHGKSEWNIIRVGIGRGRHVVPWPFVSIIHICL
jgi:hypothetical protein